MKTALLAVDWARHRQHLLSLRGCRKRAPWKIQGVFAEQGSPVMSVCV